MINSQACRMKERMRLDAKNEINSFLVYLAVSVAFVSRGFVVLS